MKFERLTAKIIQLTGSVHMFIAAIILILGWLLTGPFFNFSDSWSLFINSSTTIITFLMVFLIQNAQNKDTKAIHLKLDELIRAVDEAHDELIEAEDRDVQWMTEQRDKMREGLKQNEV